MTASQQMWALQLVRGKSRRDYIASIVAHTRAEVKRDAVRYLEKRWGLLHDEGYRIVKCLVTWEPKP